MATKISAFSEPSQEKQCTTCGETKPLADFWRKKTSADGLTTECKVCLRTKAERYYHDNRDKWRGYQVARYGLSLAEYKELYAKQRGRCAVCDVEQPVLDVDHDHRTGHVRGLLCHLCNVGVGSFQDDPDLLLRAAAYLQEK